MTRAELSRLNEIRRKRGEKLLMPTRATPRPARSSCSTRASVPSAAALLRLRRGPVEGLEATSHTAFLDMIRRLGFPVIPHSAALRIHRRGHRLLRTAARRTPRPGLRDRRPGHQGQRLRPARRLGTHRQGAALGRRLQVRAGAGDTRLQDIDVQVGKNGTLTPVGRPGNRAHWPAPASAAPACTTPTTSPARTSASATRSSSRRPARSSPTSSASSRSCAPARRSRSPSRRSAPCAARRWSRTKAASTPLPEPGLPRPAQGTPALLRPPRRHGHRGPRRRR